MTTPAKAASVAPKSDWPGRYFLDGIEVTHRQAVAAEQAGARVSLGGSGDTPDRLGGGYGPWIELRTTHTKAESGAPDA